MGQSLPAMKMPQHTLNISAVQIVKKRWQVIRVDGRQQPLAVLRDQLNNFEDQLSSDIAKLISASFIIALSIGYKWTLLCVLYGIQVRQNKRRLQHGIESQPVAEHSYVAASFVVFVGVPQCAPTVHEFRANINRSIHTYLTVEPPFEFVYT